MSFRLLRDAAKVIQENHYYPFGQNMVGIEELDQQSLSSQEEQKFQYNAKEKLDEFGLYWNDHGARNLDLQTGRWTSVDPLAEKYTPFSPYVAMGNNPVMFLDRDGREIIRGFNLTKKGDREVLDVGAQKYKDDGAIHIFCHGHSKGLVFYDKSGKKQSIKTAEKLNAFLTENSEVWNSAKDDKNITIVFHACNTGRNQKDDSESFAEKISKDKKFKNVSIIAPDERNYINEKGEVGTYLAKNADANGDLKTDGNGNLKSAVRSDKPGTWRVFKNGEQTESHRGDWKPKERSLHNTFWDIKNIKKR